MGSRFCHILLLGDPYLRVNDGFNKIYSDICSLNMHYSHPKGCCRFWKMKAKQPFPLMQPSLKNAVLLIGSTPIMGWPNHLIHPSL